MGALILMLLAMTPKIKERAQARLQAQMSELAPIQPEDPVPELRPVPEPEPEPEPVAVAAAPTRAQLDEERAAERKRRREAWFKTAAEARESLAVKQADYRRRRQLLNETDQRLKDLQDQVLKSQLTAESVDKAEQSLVQTAARLEEQQEHVAQEIANTRKSIDVLNRRQAAAKNEYSLVPYDGTSGTVRRPIYIECTGKGFRFIPEDETVSPTDLDGFSDTYNPLLAGAQTLVKFWARRRRSSPESEPEPYVLLLVRPSGCLHYYLARNLLSSLNVNFGYELIEEDWKLSVPEPDPIAKSLLRNALDATVQGRRPSKNLFADAGGASGDAFGDREFVRGRRPNQFGMDDDEEDDWGGFEGGNGSPNGHGPGNGIGKGTGRGSGRNPSVKLGPATRASRNAPGGAADDDPLADAAGGNGTATGDKTGAGAKSTAGGSGPGRGTGGARGAGMSGGSRTGHGVGDGGSDGDGGSLSPDGQTEGKGLGNGSGVNSDKGGIGGNGGSGAGGSLLAGPGRSPDRGGRQGRGGAARPATLGGSASEFGGNGGSGAGDPPLELMPSDLPDRLIDGEGNSGPAGNGPGGKGFDITLRPLSPTAGNGMATDPFNMPGGSSTLTDGTASGSSRAGSRSGSPSGAPSSSGANSSNSSATDSQGSSGSSAGDPRTANSDSGGSASSAQFGGPGASVSLGGGKKAKPAPKDDDPDAGPRISENDGKTGGPSYRSRGPRKWGQVGKKATIGYERSIEIRLLSNKILVGSKDVAVPVTSSDSDDEIVHRVINAIQYVADKWGEPRDGYYWVPSARFVVYPGGEQYSEKLSHVLEKSYGVHSTTDFAADKAVKKTAPRGKP
jgi:hypothetical protein